MGLLKLSIGEFAETDVLFCRLFQQSHDHMSGIESAYSVDEIAASNVLFCLFQYSDNYYRAALIVAAAATITPAVTTVTITGSVVFISRVKKRGFSF